MSTFDNFRKEAKRWLRALRSNDATARERLRRASPHAPEAPGLRDIQHALAREHGHESWIALKTALEQRQASSSDLPPTGGRTHTERVATFLESACWDHHVHGKGDHRMYDRAASRLLAQHPGIARDSIYTAVVSGEIREVEKRIAERPEAAREAGGSRGWTPLLYLAFTRFTHPATIAHAVDIARLLLNHGANPNDFYMAGDVPYSTLTGAAGEGEQDSPRQPYAAELFQLLLEHGARPFDQQVLYDTHFSGDVLWWLELVYAHTRKTELGAAWDDPNWTMWDMGGYGTGAYFLLRIAVRKNNLQLAEWCLSHGASPNVTGTTHPKFKPATTLYQDARRVGFEAMAELLAQYGASTDVPVASDEEQFLLDCMHLDAAAIRAHLEKRPDALQSPGIIFEAARRDRADVVAFLLDLGVPLEIENQYKQRTLHHAAAHNALRVARLLIERGAEVDPRETQYDTTPIGWAAHADHVEMVRYLSSFSYNVWTLAFHGCVERLRRALRQRPELAKLVSADGITPLWWLPDDEDKALEIVELLLGCGADPAMRSKEGKTAADWALRRGMIEVAHRLAF